MIIYYHCTRDSALLLSFTNLPSLHPLSFHEMILYIILYVSILPSLHPLSFHFYNIIVHVPYIVVE